jgi:hypothetical protein
MVRMRHDDLPDQDIEVQPIQVRAYKRAGWKVVGADAETAPQTETPAAAKGRRLSKED